MMWLRNKKTIVTHSGRFHADDVFAIATLRLLPEWKSAKLIRTRDEEIIKKADLVVDVGMIYDADKNRFDHHQTGGAGTNPNGVPYCGFGLLWKKFGGQICDSQEVADLITHRFVQTIDVHDNGLSTGDYKFSDYSEYTLDDMIKSFNPSWKENITDEDKNFDDAVKIASCILAREIVNAKGKVDASTLVEEAYKKAEDKRIIIMDTYMPFMDILTKYPEPLFAVLPHSIPGKWAIRTILFNNIDATNRKGFPKAWGGLRNEEIAKVSGVSDAIFCHNALFLAAASSKEGAIKMAQIALTTN